MEQKNLSGRQAHWIEKVAEFNFEIMYVPGMENILSDALSRLYSNEQAGTVRARSKYTYFDVVDNDSLVLQSVTMPVLVGLEGVSITDLQKDSQGVVAVGGTEAQGEIAKKKHTYHRKVAEPAEMGRPETSKEFASRVAPHFALCGPQEQNEGGEQGEQPTESSQTHDKDSINSKLTIRLPGRKKYTLPNDVTMGPRLTEVNQDEDLMTILEQLREKYEDLTPLTLEELLSFSKDPIDLVASVKGRYNEDKLFKLILENPQAYKNYEVTEDKLIFMKTEGKQLLCIPAIVV
ncbi:hypothetical protein C0989_009131 [Termitomyces sp. Mn162]|nr:hypothetical protein C0989_009131 [Termitomyces sp. Mn162]